MIREYWNIHGVKALVGMNGAAYTLKVWESGKALYEVFGSIEALYTYIETFGGELDGFENEHTASISIVDGKVAIEPIGEYVEEK